MSIEIKNLKFTYSSKTPFEKVALNDINLTINSGEFIALVGNTGSGKSTLVQHLNGLFKLQTGSICIYDQDLSKKKIDYKRLRNTVGMVFQYPEHQLFADTVEKDVAFGPRNLNFSEETINDVVANSLELVGLSYNNYAQRSPFDLSGGEKRRVAIAGVIAMEPKILILDEPTAGLDPLGKKIILNLIRKLKEEGKIDIVLVISHDIDEIVEYADRILAMNEGKIDLDFRMEDIYDYKEDLLNMGLDVPHTVKIIEKLDNAGIKISKKCIRHSKLVEEILNRGIGK